MVNRIMTSHKILHKKPGFPEVDCEARLFISAEADAFLRSFGRLEEDSVPLQMKAEEKKEYEATKQVMTTFTLFESKTKCDAIP